jgi:hypothetical protein
MGALSSQQSAFSQTRFTAKDVKSAKEREKTIKLTAGASRFYGLNLTEGFNRRERRERKG